MSSYTQYTKTANKDLYIVFRCEHCGFKTAFRQPFQTSARYTNQYASSAELAKRAENATRSLTIWQATLLQSTRRTVHERKFLSLDTPVFCPKCERTPSWAYTPSVLTTVLSGCRKVLMGLSLIIFAASFLADNVMPGILTAAGIFAASWLFLIPESVRRSKCEKNARQADRKTLPIICGSEEDAHEILAALDNQNALDEALVKQKNPYSGSQNGSLTLSFVGNIKKATVYFAGEEFAVKNAQEKGLPVIADAYLIVQAHKRGDSQQLLVRAKKNTVVEVSCDRTDTYLNLVSQKSAQQPV